MGQKRGRLIATLLAALLVLGLFPTDLLSSAQAAEPAGDIAVGEDEAGEAVAGVDAQTADWSDTGMLNADGTPVTSLEGDTAGDSGAVFSDGSTLPAGGETVSYTITLELDGGQANGLQGAGWTRFSTSSYTWSRTVTEGDTLTLNDTLGGLLPSAPYREGYHFLGWNVNGSPATENTSVPVTADTTVTARWEVREYTVTFRDGSTSQPLWTVEVPYSANLWTDANETPWTADEIVWAPVEGQADQWTASVDITVGSEEHQGVEVTRHLVSPAGEEPSRYYYSFQVDGRYYFTYGGVTPAKEGYSFITWKMTAGGTGFTVTQDSTFTAQFQAGTTYIINVHYYYADGSRVEDITTQTLTYSEQQVVNNTITFNLTAKEKEFYAWKLTGADGVSVQGKQVTVEVDQAYAGASGATKFLALTVVYSPVDITYTVEYYQQNVGTDAGYTKVGTIGSAAAPYGSLVSVTDRPDLGADVSFDGFEAASGSQSALRGGVLLETGTTNVDFDVDNGSAVIRIYYDRASYFIYFQTGTSEVYLEPEKVQYGGEMPKLQDNIDKLHRTGYQQVTRSDISWMRLDENGVLQEISQDEQNGKMPAYDVYAVVHWKPATTSIQIVYWVESRNSASFQNAYTRKVENVATEAELTVNLAGDSVTISGGTIDQGDTIVATGFQELIQQRYGNTQYTDFFSYSPVDTKTSPGNVANAQATDSGSVQEGAITQDQFSVKVNGDGSTTINVYYTRNLYTLEFVLGRSFTDWGGTQYEVATATPGTFETSTWTSVSGAVTFQDFQNGVDVSTPGGTYGNLNVMKEYRITGSALDRRAPVGRYGTKTINGYNCYVYTLTARFEAEISTLWPTANNLTQRYNNISYISMGTDANSYYRVVFTSEIAQHNVLNVYSTMDYNILTVRSNAYSPWTATADTGNGAVAHQMVAYWSGDAAEYHYYFLYEVLDTTLTPGPPDVKPFDPSDADQGRYQEGETVSYDGKVYVYTTSFSDQYSTSTKSGQNQPAKQGFSSEGKLYFGNDEKVDSNIYFFYARETYNLSIQNISAEYPIPKDILTQNFDCLENYGEGIHTLAQLGWFWNDTQNTIYVRYGGYLSPLGESEVIGWLTGTGGLEYPIPTSGENQYYFSHWYRNAGQSVRVDWTDNDLSTIKANVTLYAGWFTPRYTTTYVLNGGSWVEDVERNGIRHTLIAYTDEATQQNVFFYYPHQTTDETDTLYWYIQSQDSDRLYVDNLYICQVSDALQWDESTQHWAVQDTLSLEKLFEVSELDLVGSRLVDAYYCYMGQDGRDSTYNHEGFININSKLNTVLEEPQNPIRNGYTFSGWFYFGEVTDPNAAKIYLADVLGENQSLASYDRNYVYLNSVGDAFLLHRDDKGLYYYPSQTGYRFSYQNDASVVSHTRMLYAAWTPTSDATAEVYHLVRVEDVPQNGTFTPKGGQSVTVDGQTETITIGSTAYYVLKTEYLTDLYTGSTQPLSAWEYCVDGQSQKWLPEQAAVKLQIDHSTQTVTADTLDQVTGNTYRIEKPDGSYTYYAWFVYEPTEELTYDVYAIDLAVAVAEGALTDFHDTFDRASPPPETAHYVLRMDSKTWNSGNEDAVVVENAPTISGYTIYENWTQTLQMQTQQGTNNIYFYYVQDGSIVNYDLTYYLMTDGGYSEDNKVTFTHVPGVQGEIVSLAKLLDTYQRMITQAQVYSGYADSSDKDAQNLYDRYQDMTVTFTRNGVSRSFTVKTGDTDDLDLVALAALTEDYYLESWSPTGDSLVLSKDVSIDAYLGMAELVVQKVNGDGEALSGATFTLQRLKLKQDGDVGDTVLVDGKQYVVDTGFVEATATTGSDGKVRFQNLSARTGAEGNGYCYRLVETTAPAGYNRITGPMYVTTPYTVKGTTSYSVTYTVVNSGISYLPNAGFFGGVYSTMLLGGALMMAAVTGWTVLTVRRRPRKYRGGRK